MQRYPALTQLLHCGMGEKYEEIILQAMLRLGSKRIKIVDDCDSHDRQDG